MASRVSLLPVFIVLIIQWTRLAAAGDDYGLHLLTKSSSAEEYIFPFGGGLSGHYGRVNDITFCGGWSDDSARYVATVSGRLQYSLSKTALSTHC